MLVRITEKCDMMCSHCMVDSNPQGLHMDLQTYQDVLKHIKRTTIPIILLTGGEPTLHPEILHFIDMALEQGLFTCLLSNGTFLEKPELKEEILLRNITIQITNDPQYYSRKIPIINHPNISYEHNVRIISPFHRALKNKIKSTRTSPLCFNFRSCCCTVNNYKEALHKLRDFKKMCTPSINIDGTLAAGESNACSVIGRVKDNFETLLKNVRSLQCNRCGLVNDLPDLYKKAIGELL